jgi:hypothetical protein
MLFYRVAEAMKAWKYSWNKQSITRRSSPQATLAGQFVSRSFVVLLRKSIPQNRNLQTAAELGVKYLSLFWFIVVVNAIVFLCMCLL